MQREEIINQGEQTLREIERAKEAYLAIGRLPFTEFAVETLDCIDSPGCCIGLGIVILLAIPVSIIWKIEKTIREKKAKPITEQARIFCDMYLRNLSEYLRSHSDNRISIQASAAFVQNRYIGQLQKEKVFFGLFQKDEDWRMRSMNMAMQEIKDNLYLLEQHKEN